MRYALITGCSAGGIGAALCTEFQRHGIHVFATARDLDKLASLCSLPNITPVVLDVTSPSLIVAAKASISRITGGRLDYLVNNAGAQYVAPILDMDIQLGRELYEVNIWGPIAMIQEFAPLVIKAKGTVLNMASISGLLHAPWMGKLSPLPCLHCTILVVVF